MSHTFFAANQCTVGFIVKDPVLLKTQNFWGTLFQEFNSKQKLKHINTSRNKWFITAHMLYLILYSSKHNANPAGLEYVEL